MKKSIKNLNAKTIKNTIAVKGGDGGLTRGLSNLLKKIGGKGLGR